MKSCNGVNAERKVFAHNERIGNLWAQVAHSKSKIFNFIGVTMLVQYQTVALGSPGARMCRLSDSVKRAVVCSCTVRQIFSGFAGCSPRALSHIRLPYNRIIRHISHYSLPTALELKFCPPLPPSSHAVLKLQAATLSRRHHHYTRKPNSFST